MKYCAPVDLGAVVEFNWVLKLSVVCAASSKTELTKSDGACARAYYFLQPGKFTAAMRMH